MLFKVSFLWNIIFKFRISYSTMTDTQKGSGKDKQGPCFEYVVSRLANAFGYRAASELEKFREFWV
jgi:hypothetical protein